ncbi:MAG: GNAT family N-acetyltransferase [Candidatus Eiseniibacteriota bacterium]
MPLVVHPCGQQHLPSLRALARDPSLAHEFAQLQTDAGFDDMMADPFLPVDLRWIATRDGEPAGFAFSFLAPTHGGSFAMVRMGVVERHRRRGVGSALLAAADATLTAIRDRDHLQELNLSAWEPNPAAVGFAARHGFRHVRNFWRMERPLGTVGKPQWPAGIVVRTYDGSDRALAGFNDAYNRAFASHYHYVRSSLEDTRVITAQRHFRPDGLALAYREDECVGFCRNARYGDPGEVALIGTVPEARGIGLGRALLRWGVAWLQDDFARPVYLMVDGENESALRLYRSEGFQVALTRLHWSRAIGD